MGIEHIKELNDQAILNVMKKNKDLWDSERLKLIGNLFTLILCLLSTTHTIDQEIVL